MPTASYALIAHDLKNALGSLEGELEALIDDPSPAMAHSAYMRCTELRRQFIQFLTVYGSGEVLVAHSEDESPAELVEAMYRAAQIRHLSIAGSPKVQMQVGADAPAYWYFDRRLVQMALDAAVHNASRFAKSQIVLSLREDEGFLVFVIDDDGPGLGAHDPSAHSTGLGTELCKSVAAAHHCGDRKGRVRLLNRAEGGARFELWLP
ncbi:MAG: HAMP domain-containing sensor histidine kinase [Aquabacterium sp.]